MSVQNCNITLLSYRSFSSIENSGVLRYNVTGQGTQIFNLNLEPKNREWSVVFDGEFFPEGRGWRLAKDETITVTRTASNITIFYLDYPEPVGKNDISFCQQHSIAITTGFVVASVVTAAVLIKIRNQKSDKLRITNELGNL